MARRRTLKWIRWGTSEGSRQNGTNVFMVGGMGEEAGSGVVDILMLMKMKPGFIVFDSEYDCVNEGFTSGRRNMTCRELVGHIE